MGLLEKGVHPTLVSEAFQLAADKACEVLKSIAIPVDLKDRDALINAAMTCAHILPFLPQLAPARSDRYINFTSDGV